MSKNLVQEASLEQAKIKLINAVLKKCNMIAKENKDINADYIFSVMNKLSSKEQVILDKRFGLTTGRVETLEECAESLNISIVQVSAIKTRAISKLSKFILEKIQIENAGNEEYLQQYSKMSLLDLSLSKNQQNILKDIGIVSCANLLHFYFEEGQVELERLLGQQPAKDVVAKLKSLKNFDELKEQHGKQIKDKIANADYGQVLIGSLDFSPKTFNTLRRAGYKTLEDVVVAYKEKGYKAFENIRNLGKATKEEILTVFGKYINFENLVMEEKEWNCIVLANLNLPNRIYNFLRRAKFKNLQDLIDFYNQKGLKGFAKLDGFGESSVKIIEQTLSKYITLEANIENDL